MEGFEQSGAFNTLACVEWEAPPCENLRNRLKTKWNHSNAEMEVIRFDIQRTKELFGGFNDSVYGCHPGLDKIIDGKKINVIIGGPPCQAYSIAGRIRDENGMQDDYRNFLFESYIKVVERYQPDFFLFENVTGILSARPNGILITEQIKKGFQKAGYHIIENFKDAVFSLSDYGVPQNRKRIIILGVNKQRFPQNYDFIVDSFYNEIMPSLRKKKVTVAEAIGDLPKLIPMIQDNKVVYACHGNPVANHNPRHHSQRDVGVFKILTEDIESGKLEYTSTEKLKELYTQVTGKKSNIHKYYVLRNDQQSNTIPAHLFKDGFRHIHPDSKQCRTITVREAARLQTFSDDYEFLGSMMHQYKMIGNAVPPLFSKILATALHMVYQRFTDKTINPFPRHSYPVEKDLPATQLVFLESSADSFTRRSSQTESH